MHNLSSETRNKGLGEKPQVGCMNFMRVSRFIAHYTQSISVIWRFDINGTRDSCTFIRRKLWAARARDICTGM